MILFKTGQNPESKFYLLHELMNVALFHSSLCYIVLHVVHIELKGRLETILKIRKEKQHEKLKIIDILHNRSSLMICIVQAWHAIVERSMLSEARYLGLSPDFAISKLSVLK